MALSEFPDIFLPVILHFGSDISNGSLNHLYLGSRQGVVVVDLLEFPESS
jgi:hypothetical protein